MNKLTEELANVPPQVNEAVVSVKTMKLSDGRADYYVSVMVGDREITPHMFRIKGRAEFEVETWKWLFGQGDQPDIMDWLDRTSDPAETASPSPGTATAGASDDLQQRVAPWMQACFGPEVSNDRLERGDRFIEEALELLQSGDYPRERVTMLLDYVYGREKGEPHQEVGGVVITLAAYCLAHGLDMHKAGEDELARIWTKVEKIRAKQLAKPRGSALPIAAPSEQSRVERLETALKPFAEFADHMDRTSVAYLRKEQPEPAASMTDEEIALLANPDDSVVLTTGDLRGKSVKVTMGQTRAAAQALGDRS